MKGCLVGKVKTRCITITVSLCGEHSNLMTSPLENSYVMNKKGKFRGYQEFKVFENERFRPLYGWGARGFLLRNDPPPYTDLSGALTYDYKSLDEIKPPLRLDWATEWKIDVEHTKVDSDGWSYATTFRRLSEKEANGSSSSIPLPAHVTRRRLWVRILRPIRQSLFADESFDTSSKFAETQQSLPIESNISPLVNIPFFLKLKSCIYYGNFSSRR